MITIPETVAALGISQRTVERLVASGEIRSKKIRGSRRISVAELERLTGTTI